MLEKRPQRGARGLERSEARTHPSIPLPEARGTLPAAADSVSQLIAAFVRATAALTADSAAQLAAVRPETLRKWRRRVPRWVKTGTRKRIAAYLAGQPLAPVVDDDGFRRAFHVRLRPTPPE